MCSFLEWYILPETFWEVTPVVMHCQAYFSGCLMSRHSCLMLLRSRVWQITLREPKLPRINLVVILVAKNANKVVLGIDSYSSELLTLIREKINAILWPIQMFNMNMLCSVGFWRTILPFHTGSKQHIYTVAKGVLFWSTLPLASLVLLPSKPIFQLCGTSSWCVIFWNACLLIIL